MKKKSIVKNSIFNAVYKGFLALYQMLTTVYISRVLQPEGVGAVVYANTVVLYFSMVASLGMPNYGVKLIAQNNESEDKRSKIFFELFILNLISNVFCIMAYYIFVNGFHYFHGREELFNIMGLILIANMFNIDWLFQGLEEYKYIAVRTIIIKTLSIIFMFIAVKSEEDSLRYALILGLSALANYLLNFVNLNKYIRIKKYDMSLKEHVKPLFLLLFSAIATEIYTMLDTIMLEYFYGYEYVGYYSNAVKIVRMIYSIVIAVIGPFYPRISFYLKEKAYDESNRLINLGLKMIITIALPCVFGLILVADEIVVELFGQNFTPTVNTIRILSILVMVFCVAYLLGHTMLLAAGMEREILKATICGALVNGLANSILIPKYMHNGAAIASVLAEIVVTSILVWKGRKLYKIGISKEFIFSEIMSVMIMAIIGNIIDVLCNGISAEMYLIVFICSCVYFLCLLVTKNQVVMQIVDMLKSLKKKL